MAYARRLALLFIACCMLLYASGCSAAPAATPTPAASEIITDFHKIPGITKEEISAIERLQASQIRFTYGMLETTETFINANGTIGGYSALFCKWMTELFGVPFVPLIYDWNTLLNRFEQGAIDFTGEFTATPERQAKYHMTGTFTERSVKAFRLEGSEPFSEIAKTRPLQYAFLEGNTSIGAILATTEYDADITLLSTEEEALSLLRNGTVDAFFAGEHGAAIFPDDIVGESVFPVVYSPISLATTRDDLAPIISAFDKYLDHGARYFLTELYNQGTQEYLRYRLYTQLTDEEKLYIDQRKESGTSIPLLAEADGYPSSFYNRQEGQWQGIALEVLDQIADLTGLRFEVVNGSTDSYSVVLRKLEAGDGAMAAELIHSSAENQRFLLAEAPYSTDYYALLSRSDQEDVGINQILYARVGLIADSAYAEMFMRWFPDHEATVVYENSDAAFNALENGEIDLIMASRNLLLSATNYHENPGFKANFIFEKTYDTSFAFHDDENVLQSIVSKAQRLVDTKTVTDRWTRKVFDYRGKLARQQVPYLIGLSVLLVGILVMIVILFIKNRQMNKGLEATVAERTAELMIQTEKANQASQAKGDFLSRMSHEIRTPLNAVIGMAQIAKQASTGNEKAVNAINEMIGASTHLLGILNDVLDISKIEAGKLTLARDPFLLADSIHDVVNIIRQRCDEKNLSLITRLPPFVGIAVYGDKLRLNQVLINLLGNAVKFTSPGGEIGLSVEDTQENDETITLHYSVWDNGIGMTKEQCSRLFAPFEQADRSIAARFGGTGLGLAISQSLVKQMGGLIEVNSEIDVGSRFTFTLTFDKAQLRTQEVALQSDASALNLTGKRILLAEDIEINRLILQELLADTELSIDEAVDGQAAVDMVAASPEGFYQLIFMDIQMPKLDGYEATKAIRALPRQDVQAVPIIAMTANAYKEDIDKALAAGMNGHVSKPIDIEEVKAILRRELCATEEAAKNE